MNTSQSGTITADELYDVYQTFGFKRITKAMVSEIIAGVDADGEGSVDYKEFIATCVNTQKFRKEEIQRLFFSLLKPRKRDFSVSVK